MSGPSQWIWSKQQQDYYRITYNPNGGPEYHWFKHEQTQGHTKVDSVVDASGPHYASLTSGHQSSTGNTSSTNNAYGQASSQPTSTDGYAATATTPSQNLEYMAPNANAPANTSTHGDIPSQPTFISSSSTIDPTYARPVVSSVSHDNASPQDTSSPAAAPNIMDNIALSPAPKTITGTPKRGRSEPLDPSYYMRSHNEASRFFRKGRMFAILFTEGMGDTAPKTDSDNVSMIKHQEYAYSEIRRFVVTDNREGFCYACPVFTYGDRGTKKPGCRAGDHAIIYYHGLQTPELLPGESGITYNPIAVMPPQTDPPIRAMKVASRLNFGTAYPIQWNVKVKDLGEVAKDYMDWVVYYYKLHR